MFRILLKKYMIESLLLFGALAIVLFFFPWVRIWTISQFELSGFAPLIEQFKAFEKFSPVPLEQFLTYHGIIGITFDEPVVLLCVLTWAIARGTDVISGELGRGTMELLLAQPIPRWKLVAAHGVISVLGLCLLCSLIYAGLSLGIMTNSTPMATRTTWTLPGWGLELPNPFIEKQQRQIPLRDLVDPTTFIASTINLFSLGYAILGIAVLVSSFDQYRWRSLGIVIGLYVTQLLVFILSKSTPGMGFVKPMTFLSAYQPDWMVQAIHNNKEVQWRFFMGDAARGWQETFGPMGYISVLILLGSTAYAAGFYRFQTRDLPAPN